MLNNIYKLNSSVVYRQNSSGKLVVVIFGDHDEEEKFFTIDGLAKEVLSKIDGLKNLSTIIKEVAQPLPKVEQKLLTDDCQDFIKDLLKYKIILTV